MSEELIKRLRAIDEEAMYEAPATTHATINEAADALERLTSHPGEDAVERAKLAENVQAWRDHFSPDGKRIRLEGDNKAAICAVLDDVLAALSRDPQKEALLTAIDAWMADPSPATEQGIMDAREALSSTLSGGLDRG